MARGGWSSSTSLEGASVCLWRLITHPGTDAGLTALETGVQWPRMDQGTRLSPLSAGAPSLGTPAPAEDAPAHLPTGSRAPQNLRTVSVAALGRGLHGATGG